MSYKQEVNSVNACCLSLSNHSVLITNRKWRLQQLRLLAGLKLFCFVLDGLDEQRQSRVHRPLCRRPGRPRGVLEVLSHARRLGGEGVVSTATLVLAATLLLGHQALGGLGPPVAGVGRVQVEQVGREHGLEAWVLDVHLQTGSASLVCLQVSWIKKH